jgi:restriction endonuclease S subunit
MASRPTIRAVNMSLNSLYIKRYVDEKAQIKELWRKALGIDIWYPYYKVKDVERWAKKRMTFRLFKTKCSPEFKKNHFYYTCKSKF